MDYARRIRPLTYGDFKRLKIMFATYIEQSGDQAMRGIISAAQSSEGKESKSSEGGSNDGKIIAAFMDVFKNLVVHLDLEVHAWFCDLLEVTPEEYDKLPIDMDIQVLNQLKEAPEVGNFFTGVSLLSSGTAWLQKLSATLRSKLDTLTATLFDKSED